MPASPVRSRSRSPSRSRSRSRSRSPVTPPHVGRDYDDSRGKRSGGDGVGEDLDFDWRKVLIAALEDNSFSETSLAQETWDSLEGVSRDVACNVVKRVSESNLRNVRNLDGFTRSILRRIEESGIDVGTADLSQLDKDVADTIHRHVDNRIVERSDFSTVQVVNALKEMPVRDAIEAVDQFARSNLDHVRNRTGFFMSIIRRVKEEASGYSRDYRRDDRYSRDRGHGRDRHDRYDRGERGDRYGDRHGGDRYGDRHGDRYGDRYERSSRYDRRR